MSGLMLQLVMMGYEHVVQWNDFHVPIKDAGDHSVLARCPVLHIRPAVHDIINVGIGYDLEGSGPCPKLISFVCLLDVIPSQSP